MSLDGREAIPLVEAATNRHEAQRRLAAAFEQAGLDEAGLEARLLVGAAAGIVPAALLTAGEVPLGDDAAARLADFARRRLRREPLARILGTREFWGLPFRLSAGTLVPRPDTETVVEAALARIPDRAAPLRILDLGTGSGAILVALLSELPAATGLGIDRSADALATARDNAAASGLAARALFAASDWGAAIGGRFDLVVSNPPYIRSGILPGLEPEVRDHDPGAALDGGPDGLAAYRAILAGLAPLLADEAFVLLEIGFDQAESVGGLAEAAGFSVRAVVRDLGRNDRVVVLSRAVEARGAPSPGTG